MIPRKAKRDEAEKAIVDALQKAGAYVWRLDQPVDLLIGFRGATYLAECKTGKRKLNANQVKFFEEWRGKKPVIFRTVDDVIFWVNNPSERTGML